MTFEEWWKQMKPAEVDEFKSEFEDCWKAATEEAKVRCAQIAMHTVCDTHLPTGIKIYGTAVTRAIMKWQA
tara:strand:+ start:33 stop:245 length:213 start_codon:yes stop_codon:yes gene_type:complete